MHCILSHIHIPNVRVGCIQPLHWEYRALGILGRWLFILI